MWYDKSEGSKPRKNKWTHEFVDYSYEQLQTDYNDRSCQQMLVVRGRKKEERKEVIRMEKTYRWFNDEKKKLWIKLCENYYKLQLVRSRKSYFVLIAYIAWD